MAGAILSVTVPDTTIRSAWRGPCANGMTPSRMKSCRPIEVAMNSIAQQASPKLNTHSEYRRPQLRMNRIGSPRIPGTSAMPAAYCRPGRSGSAGRGLAGREQGEPSGHLLVGELALQAYPAGYVRVPAHAVPGALVGRRVEDDQPTPLADRDVGRSAFVPDP